MQRRYRRIFWRRPGTSCWCLPLFCRSRTKALEKRGAVARKVALISKADYLQSVPNFTMVNLLQVLVTKGLCLGWVQCDWGGWQGAPCKANSKERQMKVKKKRIFGLIACLALCYSTACGKQVLPQGSSPAQTAGPRGYYF